MKRELLIGCGAKRDKRMTCDGTQEWSNLSTLDNNKDHNPTHLIDLSVLPYPLGDNIFDEIHAYEVLEHTGAQGDYKFFFRQFEEFWRILKPGGHLLATCPSRHSVWAWGDPSHTRIVQAEQLIFLSQRMYEEQVGKTAMSDFRYMYKADFEVIYAADNKETVEFIIKAIK